MTLRAEFAVPDGAGFEVHWRRGVGMRSVVWVSADAFAELQTRQQKLNLPPIPVRAEEAA